MTPRTLSTIIAVMICSLAAPQSAFAYGEFNARLDCISKVTGWGSGYSNAHDVQVDKTGHNNFLVTGKVEGRGDRDHRFTCRVEHKDVVSWNVSSGSNKSDKALAVGAGILGLAAIAAIASKSNENDRAYVDKRESYTSGRSNPFDDMDYLQNECKRVVRLHISEDHGRVDHLDFRPPELNGRVLTGVGKVSFMNDGRHKLDYRCSFDRAGNIYDGTYEYRHDDDR